MRHTAPGRSSRQPILAIAVALAVKLEPCGRLGPGGRAESQHAHDPDARGELPHGLTDGDSHDDGDFTDVAARKRAADGDRRIRIGRRDQQGRDAQKSVEGRRPATCQHLSPASSAVLSANAADSHVVPVAA